MPMIQGTTLVFETQSPNWPELFERCPDLIPEALRTPGELSFNAVRCEGPHHVGIPWAKSMLVKEPGFTIRHQNDIDMAQSQLADAKLVLDRAYAALCRDRAVRWLADRDASIFKWDEQFRVRVPKNDGIQGTGGLRYRWTPRFPTADEALHYACRLIVDEREALDDAAVAHA